MGDTVLRRVVLFIASIAQLGVAIAMIVFIRRLSDVEFNAETDRVEEMSCSLNAGTKSDPTGVAEDLEDESLCVLAYSGAAITLIAMLALSILLVRLNTLYKPGFIAPLIPGQSWSSNFT
jgi:hypothetical protein